MAQANPEQMREQVKQELMFELKERELAVKERESEAKIKQLMAQAVQTGVQAAFSAMQAGAQVAQIPMIAPIADEVMKGAGYQRPNPGGQDPNFPVPRRGRRDADARPLRSRPGPAGQCRAAGRAGRPTTHRAWKCVRTPARHSRRCHSRRLPACRASRHQPRQTTCKEHKHGQVRIPTERRSQARQCLGFL